MPPLFLFHFFGLNSGWMAGVTYSYVSGIAAIVLVLVVALELIPLLPTTIPPPSFPISPLSLYIYTCSSKYDSPTIEQPRHKRFDTRTTVRTNESKTRPSSSRSRSRQEKPFRDWSGSNRNAKQQKSRLTKCSKRVGRNGVRPIGQTARTIQHPHCLPHMPEILDSCLSRTTAMINNNNNNKYHRYRNNNNNNSNEACYRVCWKCPMEAAVELMAVPEVQTRHQYQRRHRPEHHRHNRQQEQPQCHPQRLPQELHNSAIPNQSV